MGGKAGIREGEVTAKRRAAEKRGQSALKKWIIQNPGQPR